MKRFLFVWIVLLSQWALAQDQVQWIEQVQENHQQLVEDGGYSFIQINLVQSDEFPDLSDVMTKMAFAHGMLGMNLIPVLGKNRPQEVFNSLTSHWDPYFCSSFSSYDPMSPSFDQDCLEHLKKLFGDAIEQADAVFLMDAYGDYYGDWREIRVVLQDYESAQSLVLSFDIVHDI